MVEKPDKNTKSAERDEKAAAQAEEDRIHEQALDEELDKGLRDTFPASDPVAVSQPTTATTSKSNKPVAEAGDRTREKVAKSDQPPAGGHHRVNVSEDEEVRYWTERFGVSEDDLKEAVRTVGFFPSDVASYLGKTL